METENNIKKTWLTQEQKEEFIRRWEQSGQSRKVFCKENGITYNSLVGWCKQIRDKKGSSGFTEVIVKPESGLFAQIHLPEGKRVDLFHSVPVDYFQALIK